MNNSQDPNSSDQRPTSSEDKNPQRYDALIDYMKENTRDTIAYVLMIFGLLLILFDAYSSYGAFLLGSIFSFYFAHELIFFTNNVKDLIEEYGVVKSLILAGTLLALFIKMPFLIYGIAAITLLRIFLWPEINKR